jgi:hypothetical protein
MATIKIVKPLKALAKKKPGRKLTITKLGEEDLQTAKEALELGMPISRIPALLGISNTAFDRLLKKSNGLSEVLLSCKERGVKKHLANIARHGERNWQASAWLVERCNGSEFAQRTQTGSSSNIQINLQGIVQKMGNRPAEANSKTVDV